MTHQLTARRARRLYGRHYVADERDRKFRVPRRRRKRSSRYWSTGGLVLDQLDSPHCVGFAWAAWLAADPVRQWLDPHGLYGLAQHFDEWEGTDYDGTSVRGGAKVLAELGLVREYRWAFTVEQVAATILELGPMVLGTDWFAGMDFPDRRGRVHLTGDVLGGHAYLGIGCDWPGQRIRILSSWGREWGQQGRAWLTFADLAELLRRDGEACIATEARPQIGVVRAVAA